MGLVPHKYLGPLPTLATGIRLPSIVAPPILEAHLRRGTLPTLMLSYHRETATQEVLREHESPFRGHTGTSIEEYVSTALRLSEEKGIPLQLEADHVSITPDPARAIKRIAKGGHESRVSEEEAREALVYIEAELKEARKAGGVDIIAIDTTELVDQSPDLLEKAPSVYEELDAGVRRRLEEDYLSPQSPVSRLGLRFTEDRLHLLVARYWKSLEYAERIYRLALEVLGERRLGVEAVLDELPWRTTGEELYFYLNELRRRGVEVDFAAPNIGFEKREDYRGSLGELRERVARLAGIAASQGALLSIHSGSGAHPYSDKGPGTWWALRDALGGRVKYKVSGVYVQLLLEVLSRMPPGSRGRRLFEEIYQAVLEEASRQVRGRGPLYSPELERMVEEVLGKAEPDPRSDVFRHYFFLFQMVRDNGGRRYLREAVLELWQEDEELRRMFTGEAVSLTLRILDETGISQWKNPLLLR